MHKFLVVLLTVLATQLTVLLAVSFLFDFFGGSLAHEIGGQDARGYMLLGEQLLTDGTYHLPNHTEPETWRTPGYPFFVAIVFGLFNYSLAWLLVLLALVGATISGFIYLIGRELDLSEKWSMAAGILFGLSPAVIWIPPSGMGGDTTTVLLITVATYILVRFGRAQHLGLSSFSVGLLMGGATLIRPLSLYLSVLIIGAIYFFLPRVVLKKAVIFILVACLGWCTIVFPWMLRNERVSGHFSITSQFAFNPFYYNMPIFFAWKNGTGEEIERTRLMNTIGAIDSYDVINGFAYADRLKSIEHAFIKENFFAYTFLHAFKSIPFFVGSGVNVIYATITNEIPHMPDVPFFPRATQNTASLFYGGDIFAVVKNLLYYWPATFERIIWLALFCLAFAAPFFSNGRKRRFAVLGVFFILLVVLLSSPIAQPRYRIPAEPFIWILAALTLTRIFSREGGAPKIAQTIPHSETQPYALPLVPGSPERGNLPS